MLVRRGIVAADTKFHKLGTYINIQAGAYSGRYLIADRGVYGRHIDIYVPTVREARNFGRRKILVAKAVN
jgi:3D (Asp-Asp-Asp) domain-containing protein